MRTRPILAASALALGVVLVSAVPAQADITDSLPDGESLFAVECEASVGGFGSVDVQTAIVTLIGSGTTDDNVTCAGMAGYSPANGLGYWSSWDEPGDLFSVDLSTGEHTFVGHISIEGEDSFWLEHMAIGPSGVGYGIASMNEPAPQLVSIDLDTAEATLIGQFGEGLGKNQWWSFAYNPADDSFYATSVSTNSLYRVNVDTGAVTDLGVHGDDFPWFGISFDSEGTMWSACVDTLEGECVLARTTVADWTTPGASSYGSFTTVGGTEWFTEATFIDYAYEAPEAEPEVEEPELADTGAVESASIAFFAALMVVVGSTLIARRRA